MSATQAQKPFAGTLFWRVYTVLPAVYPEHAAQCLAANLCGDPIYLWFRPPPISEGFQNLYIGKTEEWTLDEKLSLDKVLKLLHQEHKWVFLLSDDTHERHRPSRIDTSYKLELVKEPGQTRLKQKTRVTGEQPGDRPRPPARAMSSQPREREAPPVLGVKEGNEAEPGRKSTPRGWRRWFCISL